MLRVWTRRCATRVPRPSPPYPFSNDVDTGDNLALKTSVQTSGTSRPTADVTSWDEFCEQKLEMSVLRCVAWRSADQLFSFGCKLDRPKLTSKDRTQRLPCAGRDLRNIGRLHVSRAGDVGGLKQRQIHDGPRLRRRRAEGVAWGAPEITQYFANNAGSIRTTSCNFAQTNSKTT
jgi:hypothetical protein